MSHLNAIVKDIQKSKNIHIVTFDLDGQNMTMMTLELNQNIKRNTEVELFCKPTHIAIAKEFSGEVSYSNQLPCTIKNIEDGELLTWIELEYKNRTVESIITVASSKRMRLKKGDSVTALIKASELSIEAVIDD
jgi:molybdopterin-binding protein